MQLKAALAEGIELLEKDCVPSPRLTAEVLLMHAAQCDRAHLHAYPERELSPSEWAHYGHCLNERLRGKPTQYITGRQEFWGMEFRVNPTVLIPRPETEHVVEAALDLARPHFPSDGDCRIADVGTGSGCIAVALASELPHAKLYALDHSPEALETARQNACRLGVGESDHLPAIGPVGSRFRRGAAATGNSGLQPSLRRRAGSKQSAGRGAQL